MRRSAWACPWANAFCGAWEWGRCPAAHGRCLCPLPPPPNAGAGHASRSLEGVHHRRFGNGNTGPCTQGCIGRGGGPPSRAPSLRPATVPLPDSTAFVTDRNRPQPLRQPPPTACLTAAWAASEAPSLLVQRAPDPQVCRSVRGIMRWGAPCPGRPSRPAKAPAGCGALGGMHGIGLSLRLGPGCPCRGGGGGGMGGGWTLERQRLAHEQRACRAVYTLQIAPPPPLQPPPLHPPLHSPPSQPPPPDPPPLALPPLTPRLQVVFRAP